MTKVKFIDLFAGTFHPLALERSLKFKCYSLMI